MAAPSTKTFTIVYHKTSSSSITDLTGTTWVFNNQISMSPLQGDEYVFNVDFYLTADSTPSAGFDMTTDDTGLYLDYINIDAAYCDDAWQNSAFKSITITGGTDATNPELITWLEANATLQESEHTSVNNIFIGSSQAKFYVGNTEVDKIFLGSTLVYSKSEEEQVVDTNCLTFSSPNTFTLEIADHLKYFDGSMEYSTDGTNWSTWDGTTVLSSTQSGTTKYLYVRGSNNTYITGTSASDTKGKWVLTGSNISCDGNIETLLDYQTVANGNHPNMSKYCFYSLFRGNTSIIKSPQLPATNLSTYCYYYMFYGCTSLTTAPSLPATTLTTYCYQYMFKNCTSLTVPAIMAGGTTQATASKYSCSYMYYGCTSLNIYTSSSGHTAFYKAITYSTSSSNSSYRSSYQMFYNCKINGSTSTTDYLTAGTQYYY